MLKSPGGEFGADFSMLLVGNAIPNFVPAPLIVVAVGLAAWLYFKSSRLGVATYAVGSDAVAAVNNGVKAPATRFWSFTIAGAFYGAAGLFVTANSGSGDPLIGNDMLLKVFAAVVLGGTAIGGGKGGAVGSVIGAFILTILVNVFLVLGIRTYYVPIVEGFVLIVAVLGFSPLRDLPIWQAFSGLKHGLPKAGARPAGPLKRFAVPAGANAMPARSGMWPPARILLVLAVLANGFVVGTGFSLATHLAALLVFGSFLAILGLGQGAVIIAGGLDLSVAWTITFPGSS